MFDPKDRSFNPLGISDNRLVGIITRASAAGTFHYTEEELFTWAVRVLRPSRWWLLLMMGAAVLIALVAKGASWDVFFGLLAFLEIIILGVWIPIEGRYSRVNWDTTWKIWLNRVKRPPGYLAKPTMKSPPPKWREADIYEHGFEKLLIVDRDILVDWLVKNNFHTEHSTVVIARSGYPNYIQPLVQKQLAVNPKLRVALLHDSDRPDGDMQKRIEQEDVFALGSHEVIDLGLFAADVPAFKSLRRRKRPVPIDAIPYRVLAPGLAAAVDKGVRFSTLLHARDSSGVAYGYGAAFGDDGDGDGE